MSPRLPGPPVDQPSLEVHVRHLRAAWLARQGQVLAQWLGRHLRAHPGHARTA